MISNDDQNNQLPKELNLIFRELEVTKHLRNAGITKKFGFTAAHLFRLVFCLLFSITKAGLPSYKVRRGIVIPGSLYGSFLYNQTFFKGFRMLTRGWSDGATFMPLGFSLLSTKYAKINGISEEIDKRKRSSGYKRRIEALESAPLLITSMIERTLKAGVSADYVLCIRGLRYSHSSNPL